MEKMFVLYDGRAFDDPDDASVVSTCNSEELITEAPDDPGFIRSDGLWYEYDVSKKPDGQPDELINGVPRYDLPAGT